MEIPVEAWRTIADIGLVKYLLTFMVVVTILGLCIWVYWQIIKPMMITMAMKEEIVRKYVAIESCMIDSYATGRKINIDKELAKLETIKRTRHRIKDMIQDEIKKQILSS